MLGVSEYLLVYHTSSLTLSISGVVKVSRGGSQELDPIWIVHFTLLAVCTAVEPCVGRVPFDCGNYAFFCFLTYLCFTFKRKYKTKAFCSCMSYYAFVIVVYNIHVHVQALTLCTHTVHIPRKCHCKLFTSV